MSGPMTIQSIMAVISPHVNNALRNATSLPSKSVGHFKKSERKPSNAKGYRVRQLVDTNTQYGAPPDGGNYITGGGYRYVEMLIGTVAFVIALKLDGGALRNIKDAQHTGLSLAEMLMKDGEVYAKQENINFCMGDGFFRRGTIDTGGVAAYSAPYTTITFTEADGGSYFIDKGAYYYVHLPTSPYTLHGGGAAFQCYDKPTATTARFVGDMTASTTAAAGDYLVPKGAADGQSSINRAVKGPSYFSKDTGDKFGVDVDVEDRLRGIVYDADDAMVTPQLLELVNALYSFKWGDDPQGTMRHTDFYSPTQYQAYLMNAYPLRRLNTADYTNFDAQAKTRGDGGRETVIDNHYKDMDWYRILTESIYSYVQQDFGPWNYDGQESRTIYANSSITDAIQIHNVSFKNYGCEDPGRQIHISNLGTTGCATKTTS